MKVVRTHARTHAGDSAVTEGEFRDRLVQIRDDAIKRIGVMQELVNAINGLVAMQPLSSPSAVTPAPPAIEREPRKPPRPQRPASHATNGTGRAHKVRKANGALSPTSANVLEVLKKAQEPLAPGAIASKLNIHGGLVGYHLKKLEEAGLVTMTGVSHSRRAQLTA